MEILILPLALAAMFVVLIGWGIVLRLRHGAPSSRDLAREELRALYARGEITAEEFAARLRTLPDERDHRAA